MANMQILEEGSYKTVYRDGNTVVKEFIASHPKADVFNEAYIHSVAEEAGVPVPAILGVEPRDGGWAIRMEYVSGKTIEEMVKEHPEQKEELLDRFVEIQTEVEARRVPKLRNTRYKMEEVINRMSEIDASTRYELLQRIHGMRRHTKLCHGEFVPSNVVIRPDQSYCILDWAHATSGNAGADAAITYMRLTLENPEDSETPQMYLKKYSHKADMPIQYIQKWMPIVAAVQLSKHREGERELLERWISVAEYS